MPKRGLEVCCGPLDCGAVERALQSADRGSQTVTVMQGCLGILTNAISAEVTLSCADYCIREKF